MSYNGALHWLGFKAESTEGTAESTVNTFLATSSVNMTPAIELVERKAHMATGVVLPGIVGSQRPNGKAKVEFCYSQPHPLKWALGGCTTTTPETGVYKHTITYDTDGPTSLTVEGDLVWGEHKQWGAKLSKLDLSLNPGEIVGMDIEWLARGHDSNPTITSTPAFVTDVAVVRSASVSIGGSADATVDGVELSIDTSIEQKAALVADATSPAFVRPKEPLVISGKLKFIDFPTALYSTMLAGSTFALVVQCTGDVITGAYNKYLKITLPACQITGGLDEDVSSDLISGTADFRGRWDVATSSYITVEAQNAVSSL